MTEEGDEEVEEETRSSRSSTASESDVLKVTILGTSSSFVSDLVELVVMKNDFLAKLFLCADMQIYGEAIVEVLLRCLKNS